MSQSPPPAAAQLPAFGNLVYAAALRQSRDEQEATANTPENPPLKTAP